jgi:hypothetical protein
MTQRENLEILPALDYEHAPGGADVPRMVVMAVSVAGGGLGVVWAMKFVVLVVLVIADGGLRNVNLANVLSLAGSAFCGAAGVGMIIAAVACVYRRRWGRLLMIYAAVVIGCASILVNLPTTIQTMSRQRWMSRIDQTYFLFQTLSGLVENLILPALLIWLMTRAAARQCFDPILSPGTSASASAVQWGRAKSGLANRAPVSLT